MVIIGDVKTLTPKAKTLPTLAPAPTIRPARVKAIVIAREYDVCRRSVERWAAIGYIPSIKVPGGTLRFDLEAVRAIIDANSSNSSCEAVAGAAK